MGAVTPPMAAAVRPQQHCAAAVAASVLSVEERAKSGPAGDARSCSNQTQQKQRAGGRPDAPVHHLRARGRGGRPWPS